MMKVGFNINTLRMCAVFVLTTAVVPSYATVCWTETIDGRIVCTDNDGKNENVVLDGPGFITGISVDVLTDQFYFISDFSTIERINSDGTGRTSIYGISGLALNLDVDPVNEQIYFGTFDGSPSDEIVRVSYTGQLVTTLADAQAGVPESVKADLTGGFVYWIGQIGAVARAPINGGTAEILIIYDGVGLDLDLGNSHIYFSSSSSNSIRRVNLDGSEDTEIVALSESPFGVAVDPDSEVIYWVELNSGSIRRANYDGTNIETIVSGLNQPRDIIFFSDQPLHTETVPTLSEWAIILMIIGLVGVVHLSVRRMPYNP